MDKWVDLHALWRIVVVGVLAGAGLPALFAVGLRALNLPGRGTSVAGGSVAVVGGSRAGMAAAAACFLVVLAAIAWGIYIIVNAA